MSVTYGFYNSLNGDRKYNAEQMSTLFNGIINDGIFANIGTAMVVEAYSGNTVKVGIGRAWFNGTWTQNDAILPITAEDSEVLLDRIDAVIVEVNKHEDVRENTIKIIKGTPASTPVNPTLEDSEYVHQHVLAYIYRTAESTEIKAANITNMVGTDTTPFITGILEVISQDVLLGKWRGELDDFVEAKGNELDAFKTTEEAAFLTWWANLQTVLDGDVAANLTRIVNDIGDKGYYSRNLLNPTLKTTTSNGITCTDNEDGTYTLNGTATADTTFVFKTNTNINAGLKLLGCPSNGSDKTYQIIAFGTGGTIRDLGDGIIASAEISNATIQAIVRNGYTCNNLIFKPMLVDATVYPNATYNNFQQYVPSNADISDSIIDSLSEITVATEEGLIAGALAVNELNNKVDHGSKTSIRLGSTSSPAVTDRTNASQVGSAILSYIANNSGYFTGKNYLFYVFDSSGGDEWGVELNYNNSSGTVRGTMFQIYTTSPKLYSIRRHGGADSVVPFKSAPETATEIYNNTGRDVGYTYTVPSDGLYLAESLGESSYTVTITTTSGTVLYNKVLTSSSSSSTPARYSRVALANLKAGDKIYLYYGYYGGGRIVKLNS